jgi:hypothetical protein
LGESARTYSRRGTTAEVEGASSVRRCALSRSAWPGHIHNRARLLTTTDVATVHFIQPFIRFFAMGKRQQRFSIEFLQPFSLLSDKEATLPDDTCIGHRSLSQATHDRAYQLQSTHKLHRLIINYRFYIMIKELAREYPLSTISTRI